MTTEETRFTMVDMDTSVPVSRTGSYLSFPSGAELVSLAPSPTMHSKDMLTAAPTREKPLKAVKECRVCGDGTTGTYFGATVCLPCKTFFIRYGTTGSRRLRCRNDNRCPITIATRTRCKHCRLAKCYRVGMIRKERPEVMHAGQGQELCSVCRDIANGIHFGTYTCEGCKKFFRRGLKESQSYRCCKNGDCVVNPRSRNTCRYCRFKKCVAVGMTPKVRVGRPRKAQRESILSAIQNMTRHNRMTIMTSSGESDHGSSSASLRYGDSDGGSTATSPAASPGGHDRREDYHPLSPRVQCDTGNALNLVLRPEASSPSSSMILLAEHLDVEGAVPFQNHDDQLQLDDLHQHPHEQEEVFQRHSNHYNEGPVHIQPRYAMQTPPLSSVQPLKAGEQRIVKCLSASWEEENDVRATNSSSPHNLGKVYAGDFTYLLSESLSQRYLQIVLPYWTHPLLPPGDRDFGPKDRLLVDDLTVAHSKAVDALKGPLPSAAILHEALTSNELTPNVGEFLRLRLVRILNAFISFIKSQQALVDVTEKDMLTIIRMTVNTWGLIGAATRYYVPGEGRVPHLHDIPLHPDNPHSPLNERNLHMASKLHTLHLDETEAALLAMSCILATDFFEMKNPKVVEDKRWRVLELLRGYTTAKYGWPNWRVEELFACVPEMRLAAIWFNDLSYTTWFPSQEDASSAASV